MENKIEGKSAMKESPLFIKSFELSKWLLEHTTKFPKSQRFVMGRRIEDTVLDFHDALLLATKQETGRRKEVLQQADYELERLKHYLRLCRELQLISINQYEYVFRIMAECGKMLGSWLKKV